MDTCPDALALELLQFVLGFIFSGKRERETEREMRRPSMHASLEGVFRVSMCCLSMVACCAEEKRYLLQKDSRLRLVDLALRLARGKAEAFAAARRSARPGAAFLQQLFERVEADVGHVEGAPAVALLRERLTVAVSSPDALVDAFLLCESVLISSDKPLVMYEEDTGAQVALPVERKTEFGVFLRRSIAEFDFLPFEDVCLLVSSVSDALASGTEAADNDDDVNAIGADAGNEKDDILAMDMDMDEDMEMSDEDDEGFGGHMDEMHSSPLSQPQSLQAVRRASNGSSPITGTAENRPTHVSNGATGARDTDRSMSSTGTGPSHTVIESDFERYLHAVMGLDHPAAISSLHRHFDTLDKSGQGNDSDNASDAVVANAFVLGAGKAPNVSHPLTHGSAKQFQDALLCLTSARARLGHAVEALQALNETVRVAQQHGDAACLVHCLAALCSLQKSAITSAHSSSRAGAHGNASSWAGPVHRARLVLLLRRCLSRSIELRLVHLTCFARLSLAYLDLQYPVPTSRIRMTGVSHFSAFNGELISKSQAAHALSNTVTLCSIDMHRTAIASSVLPRTNHINGGSSTSTSQQSAGASLSSRAEQQPSELYGQTFALCENYMCIPDAVASTTATARVTRAASWELFGGSGMARADIATVLGSLKSCVSPESMDFTKGWLAMNADRHGEGCAEAFTTHVIDKENGLHCRSSKLILTIRRAVSRKDGRTAIDAANSLRSLADTLPQNREEAGIEADRYLALAHLSTGNTREAEQAAQAACCRAYRSGLIVPTLNALLLLSEVHRVAGNHLLSLPHAVSALQQAQSRGLDMVAARAEFSIMETMVTLHPDHCYQARSTIEKLLPLLLAHADLELRGRALLLLVKCRLTLHTHEQLCRRPGIVVSPLKTAIRAFGDAKVRTSCA